MPDSSSTTSTRWGSTGWWPASVSATRRTSSWWERAGGVTDPRWCPCWSWRSASACWRGCGRTSATGCRSSRPEDLGRADTLVVEGRVPPGLARPLRGARGHPRRPERGAADHLRAVHRLPAPDRGSGELFAAVPRSKEKDVSDEFAGRFEGRVRRLGSTRVFPWLEEYYRAEHVTESHDLSTEALVEALRSGGASGRMVARVSGPGITLERDDRLWLVVRREPAQVQLGTRSFSRAAAEAAVAELERPYLRRAGRRGAVPSLHRVDPRPRSATRFCTSWRRSSARRPTAPTPGGRRGAARSPPRSGSGSGSSRSTAGSSSFRRAKHRRRRMGRAGR